MENPPVRSGLRRVESFLDGVFDGPVRASRSSVDVACRDNCLGGSSIAKASITLSSCPTLSSFSIRAIHSGIEMSTKNTLSKEFIASQRQRLEALKADISGSEAAAAKEANDLQESRGEEAEEYEDAAQALERKEILQSKHEVDLKRMARIERALKKIELGTYGLSDVSGKPIPRERLEAMPEAVLTVEEAAAKE